MPKQITLIHIKKLVPDADDYQTALRFKQAALGRGGQLKLLKSLLDAANIPKPL